MQMDFYYCILVNHFDRSNLRLLICRHRTIVVDWLHRLTDFIDDVHSGSHFTKCCVISIQKVGIRLYTKGMKGSAKLRDAINQVESYEELVELLDKAIV